MPKKDHKLDVLLDGSPTWYQASVFDFIVDAEDVSKGVVVIKT